MKQYSILIILSCFFTVNLTAQSIKFSSDFESGSLDCINIIDSTAYFKISSTDSIRLYSFDICSRFDLENPIDTALAASARWYHFLIEGAKDRMISMNFRNSDARRPFYSYDGKDYFRFSKDESACGKQVKKIFKCDSVYISYFVPYTESFLNTRLKDWCKSKYVQLSSIGRSTNDRDMPLLTITDNSIANDRKKVVYIHGRIHTSETPSSWHLDKMIELLAEENNLYTQSLRENIIFYILPFANPDGVVEGLSRSNSRGVNMEINWDQSIFTQKEVKNIKLFLTSVLADKDIDMFLNMHSQSLNYCTYWIHDAKSTSDHYFKRLMHLAYLTTDNNKYFKKEDIRYSKVASKYLEGWFWDRTGGKTLSTTFETPYTFYNGKPDNDWVSIENLQEQALNSVYAIGDYFKISSRDRIIIRLPNKKSKRHRLTINDLKSGSYGIYAWNKENGDEWLRVGEHIQSKDGTVKIKVNDPNRSYAHILLKRLAK